MRAHLLAATGIPLVVLACTQEVGDEAVAVPPDPALEARAVATPVGQGLDTHVLLRPDDMEWRDGPAALPPGARYAVLDGDPAAEGVFTMRIHMPDGFTIAPHWHPSQERVTVLAGVFYLGAGDVLDAQSAEPLGPGSYFSLPPGMRHYAFTEGETTVQLTSEGPWELHYVDPADDPRRRE